MTLWLTREGVNVTIHGNTGVEVLVENSQLRKAEITEHYQHMKYFWSQLGDVIKQAEDEEKAVQEAELQPRELAEGEMLEEGETPEGLATEPITVEEVEDALASEG